MQHTNKNTIKLIAHNYTGETHWFNTKYSQSEELTPELFHLYKERVNTPDKFLPADCGIYEFSSILQVLIQSQIQYIPQINLDLYGKLYDAYMETFGHPGRGTYRYIDTDLPTWESLLKAEFDFPAIII